MFNIQQDFDIFSKVYVRLKDNPPILQDCNTKNNPNQTQEDNPQQYIIYNKESHFLHSSCTQINFLGSMICNSKVVPFTFATINQTHFIGLIKAYKAENALNKKRILNQERDSLGFKDSKDSLEFEDSLYSSTSFSLPTQDSYFLPNDTTSLDYPHLEIYTLDKEQRIRLKAFLYEKQRFYVAKKDLKDESTQIARRYKEEQGNITKNILKDSTKLNALENEIKWAFKILDGTYNADSLQNNFIIEQGRTQARPNLGNKQTFNPFKDKPLESIPKGYVLLEDIQGFILDIALKDIFSVNLLDSLVGKNIVFFAYSDEENPKYCIYSDNNNRLNRIIYQDRVTSVELKIVESRFRLDFDGKTLSLLENERILKEWEARSGMPINNLQVNTKEEDFKKTPKTNLEDEKKDKQRTRFYLPNDKDTSFYYDAFLHEKDSTKPTQEGVYPIKITYNPNELNLQGIHLHPSFRKSLCIYLQHLKLKEDSTIPLRIQYQKKVLILIERFKQDTFATMSRVYFRLDDKAIESEIEELKTEKTKEKETTESPKDTEITHNITKVENHYSNRPNPFAYILEKNGPDCIGGQLKLRIPEGRYNTTWHNGNTRKEVLKLHNEFVGVNRGILIHEG
ncbi:hypothetical protein LS69_009830, partial [Helicobacter sp. MIT 05-5294]